MTTPSFFNRAEETRFAANPRPEYLFDCEIEHVRSPGHESHSLIIFGTHCAHIIRGDRTKLETS